MSLLSGLGGAGAGAGAGAAIGGPLGAGIGGAVGLLGGLFSGGSDDEAKAAQEKALQVLAGVDLPNLTDPIAIKQYQQAGLLTPEQVQKLNLAQDQQLNLTENPENRQNQQFSLDALKQLAQTGMSAQDLAQFNQMKQQVAGDTNARTQSLLQGAQMRGQAGAGDTLAAQLAASQGGAQNASKSAVDLAGQAAAARQSALTNYSGLAGQVRGQDFNTANVNNQNELLRRQFLDQNSIARQNANVAAANNANLYNTQRQQGVSDANTSAQNAELQRQAAAKQTQFSDALAKASAQSNVYTGQAAADRADNANSSQNAMGILSGVAQTAGALGKAGIFNGSGTGDTSSTGTSGVVRPGGAIMRAHGGEIPGSAPVQGDSYANDIVPTMTSPGEVVLPRSVSHDPEAAAEFVENENKKKKQGSFFKSLSELFKHAHEMSKDS